MSYRGIVKNGKIELQPPAELAEGTVVEVDVAIEDWIAEMKKLAEDVSKKTPSGVSAVEELIRSRR